MEQHIDTRILEEAQRIAAQADVLAVLLAGSYSCGRASPYSDVDLLVLTESGPMKTKIADVDWTTFDIHYTSIEELERDITRSFITCDRMLHLLTLVGNSTWEKRIETLARQRYPDYVPQADAIENMRQQVRAAAQRVVIAQAAGDRLAQAQAGGDLVWLAGRICLSLAGLGPAREDQWYELLRTSSLPFDAATPLAQVLSWQQPGRALSSSLDISRTDHRPASGEAGR